MCNSICIGTDQITMLDLKMAAGKKSKNILCVSRMTCTYRHTAHGAGGGGGCSPPRIFLILVAIFGQRIR